MGITLAGIVIINKTVTMKVQILKKGGSKKFLFLAGINRAVNPSHVTKLAVSVAKMGCIRPVVVAKIDFLNIGAGTYIIDGQHLFYALMRNDQDIPYLEIPIKTKEELVETIALLNASSKSWQLIDYVSSWSCVSGDYGKLIKYYNQFDFDLNTLANVFMGTSPTGGGAMSRVKKGMFRINNEEEAVDILKKLTDVLKIIPRMGRIENRYVCAEYVNFLKSKGSAYKHTLFLHNLKKSKDKLALATQEPGKLSEIFENSL